MLKNTVHLILSLLFLILQTACSDKNNITPADHLPGVPNTPSFPEFCNYPIETDKAVYAPGDVVLFSLDALKIPENLNVRYKYLGNTVHEHPITSHSWSWTPPTDDYRAYMAEIYTAENNKEKIYASIAVDVSSEWTKFPRYGFLSEYSEIPDEKIEKVIKNLNRHHINGIQFYDWHHKHHQPMSVSNETPTQVWKDIANRDIHFSTVQQYIQHAHNYNMKTMFYNLVYGAWENAENQGVRKNWYIFKDDKQINREIMTLPKPPFLSNILLLDPSNTEWQDYINKENKKIYRYLNFDGYHMDQLGDWGPHFTFEGKPLDLDHSFKPFIESVKKSEPDKYIAMNAVNQYGQQNIASAPSDFLYTEVWSPHDSYNDLAMIIQNNNQYSHNSKNTILAAYMNYDIAENTGYFNTPGVLFTNAVIFAFGGAHLELGEHMLGKEYFPNNNLKMKPELEEALIRYYDFLVAYQNVLRDGGEFNSIAIESLDNLYPVDQWPAKTGSIISVCKKTENRQIIHFINFKDANTMEWRDNSGAQTIPALLKDIPVSINIPEKINKIWFATPDAAGGTSIALNFTRDKNTISLSIPRLKYWSMLIFELE